MFVKLFPDNFPFVVRQRKPVSWADLSRSQRAVVLLAVASALLGQACQPILGSVDRLCSSSDSQQIEIAELLADVRTCQEQLALVPQCREQLSCHPRAAGH